MSGQGNVNNQIKWAEQITTSTTITTNVQIKGNNNVNAVTIQRNNKVQQQSTTIPYKNVQQRNNNTTEQQTTQ